MTSLPQRLLSAVTLSAFSALFLAGVAGCSHLSPTTTNHTADTTKTGNLLIHPKTITPSVQAVIGDYVSEGYAKRAQGYDWVAVMVRADDNDKDKINIKVRARSDIKNPTCSFDGSATLMGQDQAHGVVFQTTGSDNMAFFQFKKDKFGNDKLVIDSQDKYTLNYFCSGGGSIVGTYQKLESALELH
ncbi:hypothetical protein [uncultured Psychrobacter sp.]|uniref:hypothetical protein n=1 Tax=uncultured Psychrobacter sp. TaxID=259303 RepID=UPI00345A14A0